MNLQQLQQGLSSLYPQLRTRSGQLITTEEAKGAVTSDGLTVTVKTLFPPSALRRTEILVSAAGGGLDIRSAEPAGTADAQRFAELLRERWLAEEPGEPLAPLRLVRDDSGRYCFRVGPESALAAEPASDPAGDGASGPTSSDTDPATPAAMRAVQAPKRSHQKGDS